jgi:AcrR family transcriptional regulator
MSAGHDSPPPTQDDAGGVEFVQLKPGPGAPAAEVAVQQAARLRRAMIEIVAAHGYEAVKVRDVVKVAGVSSKTFYRLFGSKEDCFLRTHEAVVRSARGGLLASQLGGENWRERPRLIYAALARAVESDPAAAQVALVDAYTGGPAALEQARRVEDTFAGMIGASLARAPDGVAVPPMVIEGMMTGVARVVRNRLLAGHQGELPGMEEEMMEWVMCFPGEAAAGLGELDLTAMYVNPSIARETVANAKPATTGDRVAILAAVEKLVAADGYRYSDLTVPRIRVGAGVSRRVFDTYFDDVEECFLAALEQRSAEAVAQAARAQIAGGSWGGGVYRAINSFSIQIANDPLLARVCFQNDFAVGSKGSLARLRMITGVSDQLRDSVPSTDRVTQLTAEASAGAIWSIFHHHVLRNWILHHPEISATLGYMALTPLIGADAAVAAIRAEQVGA